MTLNIAVCMKVVMELDKVRLDPETKTLDRRGAKSIPNPPDKNAIEFALNLKEKHGGKITLISMGPQFYDVSLRLLMAMGADDAILLCDKAFAGADTYPTSLTLAECIRKLGDIDIVLCGEESADSGTGQVPPGIAEWLGFSQATYARELDYNKDEDRFVVRRTVSGGYEVVSIPRPAVVSIELGVNSPRFPDFKIKKELDRLDSVKIWTANDLGIEEEKIGLIGSPTTVSELLEVESPDRKRKFLDGDLKEVARQLAEIINDSM